MMPDQQRGINRNARHIKPALATVDQFMCRRVGHLPQPEPDRQDLGRNLPHSESAAWHRPGGQWQDRQGTKCHQ